MDPLGKDYPFYSPYHFAGNKPISAIDLDGLEDIYFMDHLKDDEGGTVFKIFKSTAIGGASIEEFKDPNVNVGYDLYVFEGAGTDFIRKEENGGAHIAGGLTIAIYPYDFDPGNEKVFLLNAKSGNLGKQIAANADEIAKNTISKKRGIIVIFMPPETFKDKETAESTGYDSFLFGHEFIAHALEYAKNTKLNEADQHDNFHFDPRKKKSSSINNPEFLRTYYSGSLGGKLAQQIKDVITKIKQPVKK